MTRQPLPCPECPAGCPAPCDINGLCSCSDACTCQSCAEEREAEALDGAQ